MELSKVSDADLQAELERRRNLPAPAPWPRQVEWEISCDKEKGWQQGEEVGLSEETLNRSDFRYTLTLFYADVLVQENGDASVLRFKYEGTVYEPVQASAE